MSKRVHVFMPDELLVRVDRALGSGQSRGEFVRRAVERMLDDPPRSIRDRLEEVAAGEPMTVVVNTPRVRSSLAARRDVRPNPKGSA